MQICGGGAWPVNADGGSGGGTDLGGNGIGGMGRLCVLPDRLPCSWRRLELRPAIDINDEFVNMIRNPPAPRDRLVLLIELELQLFCVNLATLRTHTHLAQSWRWTD